MGRRGPKPEPASVKLAKGNSGRRPIGKEPATLIPEESKAVRPPVWLKAGKGLEVWNRLAPRIAAMKLLGAADAETFARYCRNFSRWLKMQERLDKVGEIYEIETASGKVRRADPSFLISDRLEKALIAAEANFGLNPAERQRIFAARAAAGASADLFSGASPAAAPTSPGAATPPDARGSAVGFLQ
ncbi:phage terminase small subunit P27 family [Methylopila sp. M107]|uniref:phage terminase small subunit P27 family n=1 Tax=Methylopila sp. M107 TaxID=1101190 RepID=UPI00036C5806|nr:phage terminase small subunit P27 family [Methylopila sp. M107]